MASEMIVVYHVNPTQISGWQNAFTFLGSRVVEMFSSTILFIVNFMHKWEHTVYLLNGLYIIINQCNINREITYMLNAPILYKPLQVTRVRDYHRQS